MIKTIIFDFDGTLADTLSAAVQIYNHMAPRYKCKTVSAEEVQELRSRTPQEVISHLNVDLVKLPILLALGKRKMKIDEIRPFEGMLDLFKKLHKKEFTIGILTSNSKRNIRRFLKKNKLHKKVSFIYTSPKLFGKAYVLHRIMHKNKLEPQEVLYVGDETRDIEASKSAKVPVAAVSWGFNTPEVLKAAQPTYLVHSPKELQDLIKNLS